MLATTAPTPLWGKLGDQFGRKTLFQASIADRRQIAAAPATAVAPGPAG
jgi:MFS family permease